MCEESRIVKLNMRFTGDFDDLRQVMSVIGIGGGWRKRENHHQYRATTGALGSDTFQGPESAAKELEAAFPNVPAVIQKKPTGWVRC